MFLKKTGGGSKARNNGLKIASGDYIVFADSDDCFNSSCLNNLQKILEDNKEIDIFTFSFYEIKKQDKELVDITCSGKISIRNYLDTAYGIDNYLYAHALWNKVYSRHFLRKIGYLDENITLGEDAEYNNRCYANVDHIFVSSDTLYYYNNLETSLSHRKKSFKEVAVCYMGILNYVSITLEKLNMEALLKKICAVYFCGIINSYVNSFCGDKEDTAYFKRIMRENRFWHKLNRNLSGFNKLLYYFIIFKLEGLAIILCKIKKKKKLYCEKV